MNLDLSQTVLLVGENAQGKSNLLESIYFMATTKSPRAEGDSQLIKQGEGFCRTEGKVEEKYQGNEEDGVKLEIFMQRPDSNGEVLENGTKKQVKVNGVSRRASDYIGNLVVVHFSPEDINLVTGPPALRRWHLDLTLAQIDRQYKMALNQYHSALVSRNRILKGVKEGISRLDELDFWTEQMIESGTIITEKRRGFFTFLNKQSDYHFFYRESEISVDRIREYLSKEVAAAMSLIGPHRDNFIFKEGSRDLAYLGSRGEQRLAVLELKMAELKFIKEVKSTCPVLLLDDVFSELDGAHREYVISLVCGQQTIISAVESDTLPKGFIKSAQVIKVEKGAVSL